MVEGMRVLITGGAGFIGSHLTENLCSANATVVLDDLSSGSPQNLSAFKDNLAFVKGDVRDTGVLAEALRDVVCGEERPGSCGDEPDKC
jgi:nucleoside-diphosphate-sugar epimerase